jgi:hypothetical protein
MRYDRFSPKFPVWFGDAVYSIIDILEDHGFSVTLSRLVNGDGRTTFRVYRRYFPYADFEHSSDENLLLVGIYDVDGYRIGSHSWQMPTSDLVAFQLTGPTSRSKVAQSAAAYLESFWAEE